MTVAKLYREALLSLLLAIGGVLVLAGISELGLHADSRVPVGGAAHPAFPQHQAIVLDSAIADSVAHHSRSSELQSESLGSLRAAALEHKVYLPLLVKPPGPTTYYVSKAGRNGDGRSWATAWSELDQIDWDVVEPGDTILLDGGLTEMVYTTTLAVGKSGTRASPITIALAGEPRRNGRVVIFGGRSTPLPYCGQVDYQYEADGVRSVGIFLDQVSWVVIDGRKWSGIVIHGHDRSGIRLHRPWGEYDTYPLCEHITFRGIEIYDNGNAWQSGGQWRPDGRGVGLSGRHITFERVIIHDNGTDALAGGGVIEDITLRQSWLYNSRRNPTREEAFNYCQHPDGIQILAGGPQHGLLIEETIIGPGFTQGVILGQTLTPGGAYAIVHDVTLRNVLFTKAVSTNIMGYPNVKSEGWVIDHVTAHCPNGCGSALFLEGYGHTIKDSIFQGGAVVLPDGLETWSGNCQWNTTGFRLGQRADPLFMDVDDSDLVSLDDYALAPDSPCSGKGSSITSVAQLLAQWDAE